MNNGVRETLCTSCSHKEVCSFKDEFLSAIKAIDEVLVGLPSKDPNVGCMIKLRDITWIKPAELMCIHYNKNISTTREG